jgi:hypothetical protein
MRSLLRLLGLFILAVCTLSGADQAARRTSKLQWSQTEEALVIEAPQKVSCEIANVFQIFTQ